MNEIILERYINKLTKNNIYNFAKKQNITLTNSETDIIYEYIKKYYKTIVFGNPTSIFNELRTKLAPSVYKKIIELYNTYKKN